MNFNNFTIKAQEAVQKASEITQGFQQQAIENAHILKGLLFTFFLIPFRVVFIYYSFDFLSYLAYYLGFSALVSSSSFQYNWFYCLLIFEAFRYLYSFYLYYKFSD